MPDPHDTFSTFAEIAVALAGFSGIVIAFGRRSLGEMTALEVRRLTNLFIYSALVLVVSLLTLSLLHNESVEPAALWRGGSAVMLIAGLGFQLLDWAMVRSLDTAGREGVNYYVFYTFNSLGFLMYLLMVTNILVLHTLWPLLIALTFATTIAFQQFYLLVRMSFEFKGSSND